MLTLPLSILLLSLPLWSFLPSKSMPNKPSSFQLSRSPYGRPHLIVGSIRVVPRLPLLHGPLLGTPNVYTLGWAGYIKVDGVAWHWLGAPVPGNPSTWLQTEITPTRTIISVKAGPMLLNITFLSPVEPDDWVRQSFPFSYMYVDGASTDGKTHSIQLYADISAEWVTNEDDTIVKWSKRTTYNTVYHQFSPQVPISTFGDIAEDSTVYFGMPQQPLGQLTVIGTDQALRGQFADPDNEFILTSDLTAQTGPVSNGKSPVLALAVDLGQTDHIYSVMWAIGLVRDPVVTAFGVARKSYFWSQYSTMDDAIDAFIVDFASARTRADTLDSCVLKDANAVSQEYSDLVSIATRQAMAGVEITMGKTADGEWNHSDVQGFMKDLGNSQRVNPVETIYAAFPAFLYFNANIGRTLLEPLLMFQNTSSYSQPYAASDLGSTYPDAPGNSMENTVSGIENTGDMLIVVLAHARISGDGSLLSRYYPLLTTWANYLVTDALDTSQQTPADARFDSLNQNHGNLTNLAIKGIIGIRAMAEISQIMGQSMDAEKYETTANNLTEQWISRTSSSDHLRWTYQTSNSTGLMYNLIGDRLLHQNGIPDSVYALQSTFISAQANTIFPFGIPLSSDSNSNTRSDWTLFAAASTADSMSRDILISMVHKRASSNTSEGAFPTLYSVKNGKGPGAGMYPNGFASPAQGAMFSILALNLPDQTVTIPSNDSPHHPGKAQIAGAVVGTVVSVVGVGLLVGLGIFLRAQRRSIHQEEGMPAPVPYEERLYAYPVSALPPSATSPEQPAPLRYHGGKMQDVPLASEGSNVTSPVSPSVSGATSTSGNTDLRMEVEDLRREVANLRSHTDPPVYD
ncbi:DUF1793-domain-containing protein [Mycena rebaudengoi]|nr:DUF1793-domain-containing protein [Mycena rebaudengoi]